MQREYSAPDKHGSWWSLQEPIYEDVPVVRLGGKGAYIMPVGVFEALAVEFLRGRGYVIIPRQELRLLAVQPTRRPDVELKERTWCKECSALRFIQAAPPGMKLLDCGHIIREGEEG